MTSVKRPRRRSDALLVDPLGHPLKPFVAAIRNQIAFDPIQEFWIVVTEPYGIFQVQFLLVMRAAGQEDLKSGDILNFSNAYRRPNYAIEITKAKRKVSFAVVIARLLNFRLCT